MADGLQALSLPELIDRCKSGEMAAFQLVYEQYCQAMYHTCLRIVNNQPDAEDVLQESFLAAFQSLKSLKDTRAFPGWLKKIVINQSITYVKKQQAIRLAHGPGQEFGYGEEMPDEESYLMKLDAVRSELDQLPANQRIVISLHVFEDLSFEEIGKLLDMPSATARSHYARGRLKISKKINSLCHGG